MINKITRSTWYKTSIEPLLSRFAWFEYLLLRKKSALTRWGWFESRASGRSVDASGNPIPWYTYAFLDAFSDRIPMDITVFEFGSGNSTIWWADKVHSVISVEHDEQWYKTVITSIPQNVQLIFRTRDQDAYVDSIKEFGQKFDLVIIDGRDRVRCINAALGCLTDRGVVILDNSERPAYSEGKQMLFDAGFRQLRFTGFIPIDFAPSETSVFYRDGNCLGI